MATKKSVAVEPQSEEEPDRAVDPPPASADETVDSEQASADYQWVRIDQSGILTLPSGMSFNFNAGNVMQATPEDAAFIVDQGYGSVTTDPSAPAEEAPSEEAAPAEAPSEE